MLRYLLFFAVALVFGGLWWCQLLARREGRYWSGYFGYVRENWKATKVPILMFATGVLLVLACFGLDAVGVGSIGWSGSRIR